MKFLVDNQLQPALAQLIAREFGEEALHVADLGLEDASDEQIWNYVSANDSVLISKDEDFVGMILRKPTAGLIWVRIGNCRREFLLSTFRQAWPRIKERIRNQDRFIELR